MLSREKWNGGICGSWCSFYWEPVSQRRLPSSDWTFRFGRRENAYILSHFFPLTSQNILLHWRITLPYRASRRKDMSGSSLDSCAQGWGVLFSFCPREVLCLAQLSACPKFPPVWTCHCSFFLFFFVFSVICFCFGCSMCLVLCEAQTFVLLLVLPLPHILLLTCCLAVFSCSAVALCILCYSFYYALFRSTLRLMSALTQTWRAEPSLPEIWSVLWIKTVFITSDHHCIIHRVTVA